MASSWAEKRVADRCRSYGSSVVLAVEGNEKVMPDRQRGHGGIIAQFSFFSSPPKWATYLAFLCQRVETGQESVQAKLIVPGCLIGKGTHRKGGWGKEAGIFDTYSTIELGNTLQIGTIRRQSFHFHQARRYAGRGVYVIFYSESSSMKHDGRFFESCKYKP